MRAAASARLLLHRRGVRALFVDRLCLAGDVGDRVWSLIMEAIVAPALGVMTVPRPGYAGWRPEPRRPVDHRGSRGESVVCAPGAGSGGVSLAVPGGIGALML